MEISKFPEDDPACTVANIFIDSYNRSPNKADAKRLKRMADALGRNSLHRDNFKLLAGTMKTYAP